MFTLHCDEILRTGYSELDNLVARAVAWLPPRCRFHRRTIWGHEEVSPWAAEGEEKRTRDILKAEDSDVSIPPQLCDVGLYA
jgi:hypothetical protein